MILSVITAFLIQIFFVFFQAFPYEFKPSDHEISYVYGACLLAADQPLARVEHPGLPWYHSLSWILQLTDDPLDHLQAKLQLGYLLILGSLLLAFWGVFNRLPSQVPRWWIGTALVASLAWSPTLIYLSHYSGDSFLIAAQLITIAWLLKPLWATLSRKEEVVFGAVLAVGMLSKLSFIPYVVASMVALIPLFWGRWRELLIRASCRYGTAALVIGGMFLTSIKDLPKFIWRAISPSAAATQLTSRWEGFNQFIWQVWQTPLLLISLVVLTVVTVIVIGRYYRDAQGVSQRRSEFSALSVGMVLLFFFVYSLLSVFDVSLLGYRNIVGGSAWFLYTMLLISYFGGTHVPVLLKRYRWPILIWVLVLVGHAVVYQSQVLSDWEQSGKAEAAYYRQHIEQLKNRLGPNGALAGTFNLETMHFHHNYEEALNVFDDQLMSRFYPLSFFRLRNLINPEEPGHIIVIPYDEFHPHLRWAYPMYLFLKRGAVSMFDRDVESLSMWQRLVYDPYHKERFSPKLLMTLEGRSIDWILVPNGKLKGFMAKEEWSLERVLAVLSARTGRAYAIEVHGSDELGYTLFIPQPNNLL